MRARVVLLLVLLAMAFVATYGADEEEADGANLSVNEESDEAAVDGDRVKLTRRQIKKKWPCPPPIGAKGKKRHNCICYFWGNVHCHLTRWGCYCHSPKGKPGGCQVIWKGGSSSSAGPHGGSCKCHTKKGLWTRYHQLSLSPGGAGVSYLPDESR
ncbi:hypothetical protein NP493_533g01045 [Ridgeia piscesae]|uniref:Uncharacterized protein n=1 Tax=Ridgeia piscesae TaxID=27915 RepID=A0AAD9NTC9_RIDPI|nr:hypothetical protein NP493_533g01045 [Ridgeia piscesae]